MAQQPNPRNKRPRKERRFSSWAWSGLCLALTCSPSQAASPNGRKWTNGESGASLVAQMVKHLPGMQETRVWSLGWEGPPEKEMATHSSILGWRTPWTEEPDGLQSTGWQRVGHNWATKTFTYHQRILTNPEKPGERQGRRHSPFLNEGQWRPPHGRSDMAHELL